MTFSRTPICIYIYELLPSESKPLQNIRRQSTNNELFIDEGVACFGVSVAVCLPHFCAWIGQGHDFLAKNFWGGGILRFKFNNMKKRNQNKRYMYKALLNEPEMGGYNGGENALD